MQEQEIYFHILEFLEENPYTEIGDIRNHTIASMKERNIEPTRDQLLLINKVIWDLIIARVLTPGNAMDQYELPYLHVSSMEKLKSRLTADNDL